MTFSKNTERSWHCALLFGVVRLIMKAKYSISKFTCSKNLLTRQRAQFKSKRRGDSPRVIATRFTCQQALCNRGKRQGDSQRVIDTDLVHGSSIWVQNRVQLKEKLSRSHEKLLELMSNYENLSETVKALCYVRELIRLFSETLVDISDTEDDLGNKSKVNTTYNLKTYDNRKEKTEIHRPLADSSVHLCRVTVQTKQINSEKSNAFNRSSGRSRRITRHLVHVNKRDREPSRIPMKKLVHSMSRNKTRRHKIKSFIRRLIPKSSALHNLLSTRYRKCLSQKLTNINIYMWQFRKARRARKMPKLKKEFLKIANVRCSRRNQHKVCTLNNPIKILNTNKCNMQRINTSEKRFLFVCGDTELNPGPVNISSMSVLTTRLARIGRRPVNIIGDGNCFFRSISHQLYGTEDRHPQIRALAIQHLINYPEHFVEYNTHQSWLQYLQSMSRLGTWADHIIIQAVANANNLRINITESEPNFSESTAISSIYAESETHRRNLRDIYVGHLEELHYVSTTPIRPTIQSISPEITYQTTSDKPKAISQNSEPNKTSSQEPVTTKDLEKRKKYMKEYMKERRKDQVFKKKEIERKKSYNKNYKNSNPKKVKKSRQKAAATYRKSNPEKVKESSKNSTVSYRKSNPEKVKESSKNSTASYRKSNPEKVKESSKNSTKSYRKLNPEKVRESFKESTASYRKLNADKVKESFKKSTMSYRKLNPEKVKESSKESTVSYRKLNPEKDKESSKESTASYRKLNPEKVKESFKKSTASYRKLNPEKVKKSSKESTASYRKLNPEKVKESFKKSTASYRKLNPEKVIESSKKSTASYRESNPEKVKKSCSRATAIYRQSKPEKVADSFKHSSRIYTQNYPERVQNIQKRKYMKRKLAYNDNEHTNEEKRLRISSQDNSFETLEETSGCTRSSVSSVPKAIELFHQNISVGPEYICTCCDQLWYRSSVTKCNASLYQSCSREILDLCLTGLKSIDNTEWICGTCHSNLKVGKLPTCAKANKMTFPKKPDVLKDLTPLEERLISPRIPFMQVRELPSGGQLSIHGNVVNVPANVNSTVSVLPRPINESQTIPIKLKRRLGYKHHYQFQNVRPTKVLAAAQHLVHNSEIFKNEGIQVMDNYISNTVNNEDEWSEFISKDIKETSKNVSSEENVETETRNDTIDNDTDDEWCETTERSSGVMDTLLQEPDITQDGDRILSFAPGEGNRPLGIFMDKDSEFLSFPTIYCGKRQADNSERRVPVHYSTMCKWELRSQDRRVAMSVPNIFYKLKKLQIRQIQGSASLSLRKCKTKGKTYTAGDLKSENSVNKLINLDEGFRVFRNLRGSPPYFERCKKDLFAMIRQLGNPTWFCSFSAAETRWIHLIKILGRLIDNKDYTDDEVTQMTWQKKSELIQKDPVTCARNFEHMVQLFVHDFIKSSCQPIGEVIDFFYRVEFQQRGSPHIHGLFWIKNAPEYGRDCDEDIIKFVDSYISCKADSDDLSELVNLQRHKHSKTCKKKGRAICRFNFPLPPMPRTMILEPLSESDLDENVADMLKEALGRIRSLLNSMNADETMNFVEFLEKLDLTEQQYIKAIRLSLKHSTLLLKRSPSEIRINCYNPHLLKAWRANMDIQFVLDPYACAVYILSYITKGQRGMSKLLRKACEEAKEGNKNIVNKVRHIGNKFLNAVEISAQEAVYLVLQMPLRRSSREFQFINTSDPDERTFLLKSMDKIKELPDNSIDIESDNIIKRYQRRPKQMENVCLADFVAWYNCKSESNEQRHLKTSSPCADDYLPESIIDDNLDDDVCDLEQTSENDKYEMKGGITLVKRQKPRIILFFIKHKIIETP